MSVEQSDGTGIAGAMDHRIASRATNCYVCNADMETPVALRGMPGVGVVGACSKTCAEADDFQIKLFTSEELEKAVDDFLYAYRKRFSRPSTGGIRENAMMRKEVKQLAASFNDTKIKKSFTALKT